MSSQQILPPSRDKWSLGCCITMSGLTTRRPPSVVFLIGLVKRMNVSLQPPVFRYEMNNLILQSGSQSRRSRNILVLSPPDSLAELYHFAALSSFVRRNLAILRMRKGLTFMFRVRAFFAILVLFLVIYNQPPREYQNTSLTFLLGLSSEFS